MFAGDGFLFGATSMLGLVDPARGAGMTRL
jgi:hypothetical protein